MNNYLRFLSPSLVIGFGIAALLSIPGLQIMFFFILPAGAYLAIGYDFKLHPEKSKKLFPSALATGVKTGLFAALFMMFIESLLTYIFKTNNIVMFLPEAVKVIQDLGMPQTEESVKILEDISTQIKLHGFSAIYTVVYFFSNLITNIIFCTVGAVIFGIIYNNKINRL